MPAPESTAIARWRESGLVKPSVDPFFVDLPRSLRQLSSWAWRRGHAAVARRGRGHPTVGVFL
eukprot:9490957-Pyramimonas_sp.AAC.1